VDHATEKGMDVEKRTTSRKQLTEQELQLKLPNIYHFLKISYADDEKGCAIWADKKTKDSPTATYKKRVSRLNGGKRD